MLKNVVLKMQEKSPLKYILVCSLSSVNPKNMVNNKADSIKMFTRAIDKLYDNKHLSSKESDNAKLQYEEFISDVVSRYNEDFLNFDIANDRPDRFFGKFLDSLDKYKNLWKVMQIVFVVPDGQAQIERGFSINKEMVIENLEAESLRSQRLVYDSIKATPKKEIHEIEIRNKMLLSWKSASSRYKVALEENRKAKNDSENDRKRQMITEEVENVKRRRMEFTNSLQQVTRKRVPISLFDFSCMLSFSKQFMIILNS